MGWTMLARMQPRSTPARTGPRKLAILRSLRESIFRTGLALLLAAAPVAGLRAHAASAAPAAAPPPSSEVLAQADPTPTPDTSTDPDDAEWPEDQDDNDNPPTTDQPTPTTDQAAPPVDKGTEAAPDSTLKAKSLPTPAAGGLDTLGVRPSGVPKKPLGAPVAERKPFFGIHPAIFYLGLLVGHIFVVRAVTD